MKKFFLSVLAFLTIVNAHSQDYYPLNIGDYWVYNFYDGSVYQGTDSVVCFREILSNDTLFYEFKSFFASASGRDSTSGFVFNVPSNKNEVKTLNDASNILTKHTLIKGDTWNTAEGTVIVDSLGQYKVPAGTFTKCFKVGMYIYAPEIGLIKFIASYDTYGELIRYRVNNSGTSVPAKTSDFLKIFPSIVQDQINIDNSEKDNLKYKIYNLNGLVIQEGRVKRGFNSIEFNSLKGIYIIKVESDNVVLKTEKIVKQ